MFIRQTWLYMMIVIMIGTTSYLLDFIAHDSILLVNRQSLHFLHKVSYIHIMCFIFD